jgi:hypothetical protein
MGNCCKQNEPIQLKTETIKIQPKIKDNKIEQFLLIKKMKKI